MTVATKELQSDARRRWDEAVRAAACRRFEQGESAGVIAKALGLTRSAVGAMLNRAGKKRAPGQRSTVVAAPPGPKPRPKPLAAPVKPKPKPPAPVPAFVEPVELMGLTSKTCHWPLDGRGGLFCGGPVDGRGSYCQAHRIAAYAPAAPAKTAPAVSP